MITDKDELYAKIIIDMVGGNSDKWREIRDYTQRIRAESAEQARKDYQDVIDDYRRLTKELDIALNGDCTAKQASLCDIVAQVRSLGTITEIIMRSADQARKEAADMVEKAWREYGEDITLHTLRSAIIGDSATDHIVDANKKDDHIPNAGKKLDIVVKALEEIRSDACVLFGIHHPALDAGFGPAKDIIQTVDRTMKEIKK